MLEKAIGTFPLSLTDDKKLAGENRTAIKTPLTCKPQGENRLDKPICFYSLGLLFPSEDRIKVVSSIFQLRDGATGIYGENVLRLAVCLNGEDN